VGAIHMRPFRRSGNQCDCCSEPSIDTLYLCRNFSYQGRPVFTRQVGRWAACLSCRRLLEEGNTSSLACRSEREAGIYRALLINIIPGQSWSVHQVAPKVSTQAKGVSHGLFTS
jgi:hypothetical protein